MTKSTIKTIIMVVAIILALTLAGGWIAQAVVSKQKEPVQAQVSENAKDGMQVELENDGNEIQLMSALIAVDDYDEYGVSELAETAYTLNATITPATATNKNLTWALSFANPSSSWADGKTPSDYVTLTSSGTQATLSCIKAFGEPINVTATATADTSKSAQCKLNYKQRITDVTFNVGGLTYYPYTGDYWYDTGIKLGLCRVAPNYSEVVNADYTITMVKSDTYTVPADNLPVRFVFTPTENLYNSLSNKGYPDAELMGYEITANTDKTGQVKNFFDTVWAENIAGETLTASEKNELIVAMKTMDILIAYHLDCYIGDVTEPVHTYSLHLDMSGYSGVTSQTAIDNVSFDKSEITF